jgi:sarcosine oxidase/L-pipecolate oxidase
VVKDQCQVVRIDPGPPATVVCKGHLNTFSADSVVITAGPWTAKILKRIGMDVKIQSSLGAHMYFPVKEGASISDISFIHYDSNKRFQAWTHPTVEYPGLVKVCSNE